MSSVSAFQIKVNKEEYNQKKREAAKVIDNMYKLLLEKAEEIREEKRRKNVIREIEKAREDLWSMLSENTPYYYTEMKIHLRKDPFIRIFHGAEYYIKEILNLIEKEKAFVEEKRKDIEKILKKIETIKEGKTIFSKDVLQKISHFDKSLIEKDINKAEREIKKIIPFLEKALREEKGLKKLEEIISSLKTEEKTEKNTLSLLEEEKN
ncbi:hypothetical protein [Persephonella sp. KM09-Lau-8]|uniref:hypothetical protein n=1 Tax=Persephonella sp. KM09-Lau-8 TaxID=1158345 RepID=UPI00049654EE|nr:hypothetical protein [Persephonella sp. KM09-Lau-8]